MNWWAVAAAEGAAAVSLGETMFRAGLAAAFVCRRLFQVVVVVVLYSCPENFESPSSIWRAHTMKCGLLACALFIYFTHIVAMAAAAADGD